MIFLKLAFRTLWKKKLSTIIALCSLVVGFTIALYVGAYVFHESSYDRFHEKENLYRVSFSGGFAERQTPYAFSWAPLGPRMKSYFPEVKDYVRMFRAQQKTVEVEKKKFVTSKIFYADANFFQFFSFTLLEGEPTKVLQNPNTAVLTMSMARQYFGDEPAIGKQLSWDGQDYLITGIAADPPANSHNKFKLLASMSTFVNQTVGPDKRLESWRPVNYYTYLHLSNDKAIEKLQAQKQQFIDKEMYMFKEDLGVTIDLLFYPIEEIHLASHLDQELEPNNRLENLAIVALIGLFVLVLSSVNYILITTHINAGRYKEVFVKRVAGENKHGLLYTHLLETLILSVVSFALGILLYFEFFEAFSSLLHVSFQADILMQWQLVIGMLLAVLLVGTLPGVLAAKIVLHFPTNSAKPDFARARSGKSALLLFVQFSIALGLVITTLIFTQQLQYIQKHDLGYNTDELLLISLEDEEAERKAQAIKSMFTSMPEVSSVSGSARPLTGEPLTFGMSLKDSQGKEKFETNYNFVDYDFAATYGLKLRQGRFFSPAFGTDSAGIVVNETFCRQLGIDEAIGKEVVFLRNTFKIIGVAEDFQFHSLRNQIEPYAMLLTPQGRNPDVFTLKVHEREKALLMASVAMDLEKAFPDALFAVEDYDDAVMMAYQDDRLLRNLLLSLTMVIVFMALIGVLGQHFLMIRKRRKELAVRKVMGAGYQQLVWVLSRKYVLLFVISWLTASVLSFVLTRNWLMHFASRLQSVEFYYILPMILGTLFLLVLLAWGAHRALMESPAQVLKED